MIFRPATETDIKWVHDHLRPAALREMEGQDRGFEEAWHASLFSPGAQRLAFINDQNECVAIVMMTPAPQDYRPNSLFVGMHSTEGIEKEPIGFLRALRAWRDWVFETQACDEMFTWISDHNQTSFNMALKFMGFTRQETHSPQDPNQPKMHLVFFRRPAPA